MNKFIEMLKAKRAEKMGKVVLKEVEPQPQQTIEEKPKKGRKKKEQ
jgi:hypothetical protein